MMMPDFTDMLSKAKEMQSKMKEAQDAIKNIEVEGDAGGNLVKVILTGDYEIKAIKVSEEAKKESNEIVNDLIIAAYNNAKEKLKKKSSEELSKATGGMNLPFDFKLPF
jgi:DNA-binding YbaB/EbfC family protein|tara:strand:+ start:1640 stop:1966 length:327 start_codon:yes stop_codon:yes gene_type:complete